MPSYRRGVSRAGPNFDHFESTKCIPAAVPRVRACFLGTVAFISVRSPSFSAKITSISKLNFDILPRIRSLIRGCVVSKRVCNSCCECRAARFTMAVCRSVLSFSAAASSGENPRSSNAFRLIKPCSVSRSPRTVKSLPFLLCQLLLQVAQTLACNFDVALTCLVGLLGEAV